ncbi:MAG: phage baseplate assembly protein V, partial [Pseudonocardiaceae bacterium]
ASTAARAGLYPVAHGGELRLVTLLGYGPPVDLELGVSLLQAEVEANLDQACSELTALGWDSRTAEPFEQRAGEPRSGRQIPLRPEPGDVGVDGTLFLVDQRGRSADELAALAQAAIDVRAQGAVTLTGVAEGDAQLRAGRRIAVRGMAERVAGTYVLTEAIHTVDATGYLTALSTEPDRDGIDRDSRDDTSITLGVVTDVDDPERLGRVRISLLAHGEAEVGWLGVMCPGAGKDKGFLALPDTGDTVLVALPHGPVGGVVLGSLYGGIEPPDPGVHDGAVRRWSLRTADGQALVADDAAHRLTLANQAGTVLDLAPGVVTLHCATDLMIQAPGRAITVRAKSVDFVHAPEPEDAPAALATDGGR